jgi:hypothetical protein
VIDARLCRRKAEEFANVADSIRDDLRTRLCWLILSNVWSSLAEHLDRHRYTKEAPRPDRASVADLSSSI